MIQEASILSDYMTATELSIVTSVCTTLFLSYLLPTHCNPTLFLRAYYENNKHPIASLEDRLAIALTNVYRNVSLGLLPHYQHTPSCHDDITASSFYRFLEYGLGPYLSCGKALVTHQANNSNGQIGNKKRYTTHVDIASAATSDLLRLLSMAICSCPSSRSEENGDSNKQQQLQQEIDSLSTSTFPYTFNLVYTDKLRLIRLCAEDLILLPRQYCKTDLASNADSTTSQAMAELRRSLLTFASRESQSEHDACLAYKAYINIIAWGGGGGDDDKPSHFISMEFQRLLDIILKSKSSIVSAAVSDGLSDLMKQYNRMKFNTDKSFISNALSRLMECIRERVQACKKEGDAVTDQVCKPYVFTALLRVTESLIHLLPMHEMRGNGDHYWNQLLYNVSILLLHPSISVVEKASECLATAFSYDQHYLEDVTNVKHLYHITKECIENIHRDGNEQIDTIDCVKGVIYTASRKSGTYAFHILSYYFDKMESRQIFWRVASIFAPVQPRIVIRVLKINPITMEDEGGIHQVFTVLSCTLVQRNEQLSFDSIIKSLGNCVNNWTLYGIMRHSFVCGSFGIARQILEERLIKNSIQQCNYLWLSSLARLAAGEEMLRNEGCSAIPSCLTNMNACHSMLLSLASLTSRDDNNHQSFPFGCLGRFDFQVEWLMARIEFLQLIKTVRGVCVEYIMLTAKNVSGNSRIRLHLKNLPKCFAMLVSRYIKLYRLFGLHFCHQSCSALRGMISMCSFLSEMIDLVFHKKPSSKNDAAKLHVEKEEVPIGDKHHPMAILLSQLRSRAAQAQTETDPIEPEVLLEVMDTLLKYPVPFPTSTFVMKPIPLIHSTTIHYGGSEMMDVAPGMPIKFMLSGVVPEAFSTKVSFYEVVAWPVVCFMGPLLDEEEYDQNEDNPSNSSNGKANKSKIKADTTITDLLPSGRFVLDICLAPIVDEGYYTVDIQLGCRDVCCHHWHLPSQNKQVLICVNGKTEM